MIEHMSCTGKYGMDAIHEYKVIIGSPPGAENNKNIVHISVFADGHIEPELVIRPWPTMTSLCCYTSIAVQAFAPYQAADMAIEACDSGLRFDI